MELCTNALGLRAKVGVALNRVQRRETASVNATRPLNILIVEDELLIRMVVSDAFREEGFSVIEASSGDEAVDVLTAGKAVDLIFSDVRMPGSVDGLGLLAFVKDQFPGLPVILTSGHLEPSAALTGGANHFLHKPYRVETVLGLVASEMAKSA
jgi:CheY-like chemotaxis protein